MFVYVVSVYSYSIRQLFRMNFLWQLFCSENVVPVVNFCDSENVIYAINHLRTYVTCSSRGLLGYVAVFCCGSIPTFRRILLPHSSHWGSMEATWSSIFMVKMEAARAFETSVSYRNRTWRHNSEDLGLNLRHPGNPKCRLFLILFCPNDVWCIRWHI